MKKLLYTLYFILCAYSAHCAEYNAVLVADMNTGNVLYSENASAENYPASLTKIMTLYLTFDALEHERLHADDLLIVSQSAASASPVKLGLAAGSKISVEDAIKAVAVYSANDAARVLAENLRGGREGTFASLMTDVASQVGLQNTNFENSSGLPDDEHVSSARDIALLSLAVYKHFPGYWKYFSIRSFEYGGKTYNNGNRLLGAYPGADGMKTGFTNKSKYSLVATANRNGARVMAVVLGAPNKDVRAMVATRMLDRGFGILGQGPSRDSRFEIGDSEKTDAVKNTNLQSPIPNHAVAATGGNAGVQFGAFSTERAARTQQKRVSSALNVSTVVEQGPGGLWRVRATGLSDAAANKINASCKSNGIDCYVFH
ncbi:MAG: serine hydrolase [Rickettsiales bacterium]|jgi:D-alanyl-D-alanine carboxypeptidase|nr:serine hydrolase [Rickettsiales bacterium]